MPDTSRIDVLDHGFVRLDAYMADDLSVVNAARVSFAKHKDVMDESDEGLIRFLMRDHHGTPFEHNAFRFHIRCPLFVAREWFRHRIGCLSADTLITCFMPNGTAYAKTIKQIHDLKHGVTPEFQEWFKNGLSKRGQQAWTRRMPRRQRNYRSLITAQERMLRVLDEETGLITAAPMGEVWESGVKELFLLRAGERQIRATADHRFLTPEGWKRLGELDKRDMVAYPGLVPFEDRPYPPSLRAGIGVWTEMMRSRLIKPVDRCYLCGNDFPFADLALDHVVPVVVDLKLALDERNLKPACTTCHREKTNTEQRFSTRKHRFGRKWALMESRPTLVAEGMTYDISVDGPANFEANRFIVHNSFNEFSMRYAKASDEFYLPPKAHLRTQIGKPGAYTFEPLDESIGDHASIEIQSVYDHAMDTYEELLDLGVAREVARIVLPMGAYTEFFWTVNARSLMHFLSLRTADTAQLEIRLFADAVQVLFKDVMPVTYRAYVDSGRVSP